MHQIEVNIIESQGLETPIQAFFHVFMVGIPKLGSNENVFSLGDALFKSLSETFADFLLVLI